MSWLVLEQIPKSGGENKTSGYTVKAKQENRRDKQTQKTQKAKPYLTDAKKPFLTLWLTGEKKG